MPSANIFRFSVFRGAFLEFIFFIAETISYAFGGLLIFAMLMFLSEGSISISIFSVLFILITLSWGFVYCLKRIVLRRLDISLQEDYVDIVYLRFLVLPERILRLSFSEVTGCKQVRPRVRWRSGYLRLTMKNGEVYRISNTIRWLKKIEDPGANFSIEQIAQAHQLYRQKQHDSTNKPGTGSSQ